MSDDKPIILTGDRPTGQLHLGHYVGSLRSRVAHQDSHNVMVIIADFQVLTDHLQDSKQVEKNIREVVLDYLSVGIDPEKATIFIQSAVPQLADLTMYFSFLVTVARLRRNPTVKKEALQAGVDSDRDNIVYGFLGYPISQAADILLFRANLVPVGEDQKPHLEQTREIARTFNRLFGQVFPLPEIESSPSLPDLSGQGKMSKSQGNPVSLADPFEVVRAKMMQAVTDPDRKRRTDPGNPYICPVYSYHENFNPTEAQDIAQQCRTAGIGCVDCKKRCAQALRDFLAPIQERRFEFEQRPDYLADVVKTGTAKAIAAGEATMELVREAIGYNYPSLLE